MPVRLKWFGARIGHLFAALALVSIASFSMLELLPGNLAYALVGESATPEQVARVEGSHTGAFLAEVLEGKSLAGRGEERELERKAG